HPRLHDQPHAERAAVLLTDRVGLMLNPTMRASPRVMTAMRLHADGVPLALDSVPMPVPGSGQVLLEVLACGVCRTDLHVVDGELPRTPHPITPGHEIVGRVIERGQAVTHPDMGERVGVPWLGYTCGVCRYCRAGLENLCDYARFTGYTLDGGYAQFV